VQKRPIASKEVSYQFEDGSLEKARRMDPVPAEDVAPLLCPRGEWRHEDGQGQGDAEANGAAVHKGVLTPPHHRPARLKSTDDLILIGMDVCADQDALEGELACEQAGDNLAVQLWMMPRSNTVTYSWPPLMLSVPSCGVSHDTAGLLLNPCSSLSWLHCPLHR
jgi:hypothetical protein